MKAVRTAPTNHEDALHAQGIFPLAGVDEAGRGPLAGPVIACALVLPPGCVIAGVNDSKQLSAKRRAALREQIQTAAVAYAYGVVDAATIDRVNILQATMQAMAQAVQGVADTLGTLGTVLIDGNRAPALPYPTMTLVRGDACCHLIAAASILAKEERDRLMKVLDTGYPQYGFARHKGYGTAAHFAAIEAHGLCPAHRRRFLTKYTDKLPRDGNI